MKVAVVGAGISGLATAMHLERAGVSVTMYEARDRVGGNLHTVALEDDCYEAGGEWIDAEHHRCLALLDSFGTPATPADERPSRLLSGGEFRDDDDIWEDAMADLNHVHEEAKRIAGQLPERVWDSTEWRSWDERTVADFVADFAISPHGKWLARAMLRSDEGQDIEAVGLLGWLDAYRNYMQRGANQDGMSSYRFPEGAQRLCERMRGTLQGDVHMLTPVRKISHDERGATVHTGSGEERYDHVVMTLPPQLLKDFVFDPAPGGTLPNAWRAAPRAPTNKVALEFDEPFWETEDWGGALLCDLPIQQVWSGARGPRSVLLCYICGAEAEFISGLAPDQVVARTLRALDETHPGAKQHFVRGQFHNWVSDPWSQGGFTYSAPGFATRALPYLSRSMGRIHFAGEATAAWFGFIEGALESAERAAKELTT